MKYLIVIILLPLFIVVCKYVSGVKDEDNYPENERV